MFSREVEGVKERELLGVDVGVVEREGTMAIFPVLVRDVAWRPLRGRMERALSDWNWAR